MVFSVFGVLGLALSETLWLRRLWLCLDGLRALLCAAAAFSVSVPASPLNRQDCGTTLFKIGKLLVYLNSLRIRSVSNLGDFGSFGVLNCELNIP